MKKFYLILLLMALSGKLFAQFVVSDPTAITQRITLFLNEMNEKLLDRNEMVTQTFNTTQMLKQAQEGIQKLQKVSAYVQGAKISYEIIDEGVKLAKQVQDIQQNVSRLTHLTDEEISNAICFSAELGDYIADKVEEANEMLSSKKDLGEMSDYERIQLLKSIKSELVKLRGILTDVQKRFKNKNAYALCEDYLRSLTCEMIFFAYDQKYGLHTSQVGSVVKEVQKARKKQTKSKKSDK